MAMTKKDYELIAASLNLSRMTNEGHDHDSIIQNNNWKMQHIQSCVDVAHTLSQQNPRFNKEFFYKACGI